MKSLVFNICLEYLLNEWVYSIFNVQNTNKNAFIIMKDVNCWQIVSLNFKIWHPSWDQLAFVCKCLEYVEELSIFICWPVVKKGFQIFWLWKYFPRVCTFIPVQILPCVYLVLRIEKCHTLYFLTFSNEVGIEKETNDTWHLFKTKAMVISRSSWKNAYKDSYRFVPRHQICHS